MGLKARLLRGDLTIGSWITMRDPTVAEIMAKAGFDWLAVDLEHSMLGMRDVVELVRVIDLCGVAPLVRLPANDQVIIKRVLDGGAHGVIVPMVNTKMDAEQAISAVYYPPRGTRGVGVARAHGYGAHFEEYMAWLGDQAVVIVQLEHISAVQNVESILSLVDVDGYIVGPYDLSASMGIPGQLDHPDVVAAVQAIQRTADALNKPGGVHVVEPAPEKLQEYIEADFRFLAYSTDFRMLDTVCRAGLSWRQTLP